MINGTLKSRANLGRTFIFVVLFYFVVPILISFFLEEVLYGILFMGIATAYSFNTDSKRNPNNLQRLFGLLFVLLFQMLIIIFQVVKPIDKSSVFHSLQDDSEMLAIWATTFWIVVLIDQMINMASP